MNFTNVLLEKFPELELLFCFGKVYVCFGNVLGTGVSLFTEFMVAYHDRKVLFELADEGQRCLEFGLLVAGKHLHWVEVVVAL